MFILLSLLFVHIYFSLSLKEDKPEKVVERVAEKNILDSAMRAALVARIQKEMDKRRDKRWTLISNIRWWQNGSREKPVEQYFIYSSVLLVSISTMESVGDIIRAPWFCKVKVSRDPMWYPTLKWSLHRDSTCNRQYRRASLIFMFTTFCSHWIVTSYPESYH